MGDPGGDCGLWMFGDGGEQDGVSGVTLDVGFRVDGVGEDGDVFECDGFKWTMGVGFSGGLGLRIWDWGKIRSWFN